MRVRVRWMVFVLALMTVAAFNVGDSRLASSTNVAAQAPIGRTVPIGANPVPFSANPILNSDAFWLGIILALVLALAFVYVRWAVFERQT